MAIDRVSEVWLKAGRKIVVAIVLLCAFCCVLFFVLPKEESKEDWKRSSFFFDIRRAVRQGDPEADEVARERKSWLLSSPERREYVFRQWNEAKNDEERKAAAWVLGIKP